MRLTSKKTLPVLIKALSMLSFTQTQLAKETKTSIGRVNKIITFLKQKEIVIKENAKYVITQPNKLADIIAAEQIITKKRTYSINLEYKKAKKLCTQNEAIFCLQSALATYEKKKDDDELHIAFSDKVKEALDKLPRGNFTVHMYEYDSLTHNKDNITEQARTIIDLKSINQEQHANDFALKVWGTMQ